MYERGEVKVQEFEHDPRRNGWFHKDLPLDQFLKSVHWVSSVSATDKIIVFYTESKTKLPDNNPGKRGENAKSNSTD